MVAVAVNALRRFERSGNCSNCGEYVTGDANDRLRKGRCDACYRYWRNHYGNERPRALIEAWLGPWFAPEPEPEPVVERVVPTRGQHRERKPRKWVRVDFDELAAGLEPPAWMGDALCLEYADAVDFFPGVGESCEDAKAICAQCLVQSECLDYALELGELHGVWGGTSGQQRRALRRARV